MWQWLRRRPVVQATRSLQGKPVRVRTKTYSAASGYVYRYVYSGWRACESPAAIEHVFEMTVHGENTLLLRIHLRDQEITEAERLIGRPVLNAERYAIAKMTLFLVLDEAGSPEAACAQAATPRATTMRDHLALLGRI